MALVCSQCSRVNPKDAAYCYWDGASLAGRGGPVNAGAQPFPSQFVFPNGTSCRNFDQLAMACQQNWSEAVNLLKQGYLASFFGGMGRVDLAAAAKEAGEFPDLDRGLDGLLAKLPSQALQPPKLKAEPSEINIGQIRVGTDRSAEIHLFNQGMRLLYGSVSTDAKWLTVGEGQGQPQKMFQFGADAVIPIQVRGQHLQAKNKPIEGHLVVESNGGNFTITVRADVPVTPFQEPGLFQGCVTPRQVAEKAKANPKGAMPIFESGAVHRWFQQNGWTYPVQGPVAKGAGGIQQFFEALGLAKPPKLDVAVREINLKGEVGYSLFAPIEISTQEKKYVYAHAHCEQAWVDASDVKLGGNKCTITLKITVPPRPGETLDTNVHVTGNGNQRFTIPLRLAIGGVRGSMPAPQPPLPAPPPVPSMSLPQPYQSPAPASFEPVAPLTATAPSAAPNFHAAPRTDPAFPAMQPMPPAAPNDAFASGPAPAPAFQPTGPANAFDFTAESAVSPTVVAPTLVSTAPVRAARATGAKPAWFHGLPAGILLLAIITCLALDMFIKGERGLARPSGGDDDVLVDDKPKIYVLFDTSMDGKFKDKEIQESFRFGLIDGDYAKRLTYHKLGLTNSTVLKLGGKDRIFGKPDPLQRWVGTPKIEQTKHCTDATMEFQPEGIYVTQNVKREAGDAVLQEDGSYRRFRDTCFVEYVIVNKSPRKQAQTVSLRFLLDTFIGTNDETFFTVPGINGLVSRVKVFDGKDIPDRVQAFEKQKLSDPGMICQLTLTMPGGYIEPTRVCLVKWPGKELYRYDVAAPANEVYFGDSAIAIYWENITVPPGQERKLGFFYGVGNISREGSLALSLPKSVYRGRTFKLVGYVSDLKSATDVVVELPKEISFADGSTTTLQVKPSTERDSKGNLLPSLATWNLVCNQEGTFDITVRVKDAAGNRKPAKVKVHVKSPNVF
jgi:hypothetical protein